MKPAKHWKARINAVIDAADEAVVHDAIIHFTGSCPESYPISTGKHAGKIRVRAAGYWSAIGA